MGILESGWDRVHRSRQSRTPRRIQSALRLFAGMRSEQYKDLVPNVLSTFFDTWKGRSRQTGQKLLVGRIGVMGRSGLFAYLAIAFQIHQAIQAEKPPGKQALNTSNTSTSSPAETTVRWSAPLPHRS